MALGLVLSLRSILDHDTLHTVGCLLLGVPLVAAPLIAAVSSAMDAWRDRRDGVWSELRVTRLSADEILLGRVAPMLLRTLPLAVVPALAVAPVALIVGADPLLRHGLRTASLIGAVSLAPMLGVFVLFACLGGIRSGMERGDRAQVISSASMYAAAVVPFCAAVPFVIGQLTVAGPAEAVDAAVTVLVLLLFYAWQAWALWGSCARHLRRAESMPLP